METTPQENDRLERQAGSYLDESSSAVASLSPGERTLPYLLALMETCWVDAIIIGIAGVAQPHTFLLPLWVPFVILAGSCWLSNAFAQSRATPRESDRATLPLPGTLLVSSLLVGAALFSLWAGLYASSIAFFDPTWLGNLLGDVFLLGSGAFRILGIIVLLLYFYWRGLRLSRKHLEPGNVFVGIWLGIGVMLAVIVYQAATNTSSVDEAMLLLLIPLFLISALIAHAFAQTAFMRALHRSGLQGSVSLQERALFTVSIAFGTVLFLVSLLVGAIASPAFLVDAQRVLAPVGIAYDWFTRAIAFIMTLIIAPFIWLLQVFHFRLHDPNYQIQTPQVICKKYPHAIQCVKKLPPPQNPSDTLLLSMIKILLPIVIILLIVSIVWLLMRTRRVKITRRVDEIHESLWSWELFLRQLQSFFRALWLRLFPQRAVEVPGQGSIDDVATEPTARSIREVYRAMLRWAADRGYPRKRDETPYEFRLRLHTRLPLTEPELGTVTEAYTAIRYGRVVPSEDEVAHVQQIWSQLRQKSLNKENRV